MDQGSTTNLAPGQTYTNPFMPQPMPLGKLPDPFGLGVASEELNKKIEETISAKLDPLLKRFDEVKPMVEQHAQNERQKSEQQTKQTFVDKMNQLMELGKIAGTVVDGQRLEKIFTTYRDVAAESFVRQDINILKRVVMNEALAFVRTEPGKKWLQTGIDAFFGMRERGFR
jgi:hypothetical protein